MASMLRHAGVVADRAAPSRAMAGVPKRAASVSIPRGGAGRVAERASVRWNPHPPWSRRSAGTASPSGRGDAVAARSTDGASSAAASSDESPARLVLYTKPGCCLCDGLKETLDEVLASDSILASAPALRGASLELRDVSTNEEWAAKHAMEVPVLHLRDDDGTETMRRRCRDPRRGSRRRGWPFGSGRTSRTRGEAATADRRGRDGA